MGRHPSDEPVPREAPRRLLDRHAISRELVPKLLAWRHPGFSAHVGEPIRAEDKRRLEDTAAYLVRNPLSLKKLMYLDGHKAVLYRSRMNPSWGRNFEALCSRCDQRMQIVAFLTDSFAIERILGHLGLAPTEEANPPPIRELLQVAEQGEAWGVPANWAESEVATATRRAQLPRMTSFGRDPRRSDHPPTFGRPARGARGSFYSI